MTILITIAPYHLFLEIDYNILIIFQIPTNSNKEFQKYSFFKLKNSTHETNINFITIVATLRTWNNIKVINGIIKK